MQNQWWTVYPCHRSYDLAGYLAGKNQRNQIFDRKSTCQCPVGGKIEFMTSGQVPLPDDAAQEVKDMQDQAQRELDDSGHGDSVGEAGFVEG